MMNLNNISTENLERIQKLLKIVLDELELQSANRIPFYKITSKRFEEKGLSRDEAITILNRINIQIDAFLIVNEYYREKKEREERENSILSPHHKKAHIFLPNSEIIKEQIERELHPIESLGLEKELDTNIILIVKNLNKLKKIKESVDKKLEKISKSHIKKIKTKEKTEKEKNLITRDKESGDFRFRNKLIEFRNKKTIYYLVFECLYEEGDLNGFCPYNNINEYLEKHDIEKYYDNLKIRKRIRNGISNLHRFSNLEPNAPDGKKLIDINRGKGITLYNPSL